MSGVESRPRNSQLSMFPNPIALNNGTIAVNFDNRGNTENQSNFIDASASLDQTHTLTIAHTSTNVGKPNETRRSKYRFDRVVENAQGVQGTVSVYLNVVVPTKVATSTQVTEEINLMMDFLGQTGFDGKILRAEI